MRTLQNIQLLPVIQLYPPDMNYPMPRLDTAEEHYAFWKDVMTSNGLQDIEPIQKGLHYVSFDAITDADLKRLMELHLKDFEPFTKSGVAEGEVKDYLPHSLEGGVILMADGVAEIPPQCCVSLQDYKEWIAIKETTDFEFIWLGHPWIYYKMKGEQIYFTRLIEKDFAGKWRYYQPTSKGVFMGGWEADYFLKKGEIIEDSDILYEISTQELFKKIEQLQLAINIFKQRIEAIGKALNFKNPNLIATCLVDGNGQTFSYDRDNLR